MFVGTFEGTVCACMFVLVHLHRSGFKCGRTDIINKAYFVESVIVLSVVIDRLANKDALLARVVVLPLVVDFYVLLHHAVLA